MEPNAFVAEVYRRMSLRHAAAYPRPSFAEFQNNPRVLLAVDEYAPLLPSDKKSAILDIGFGDGWFLAACLKLGYTNLSGADFGIENKRHVADWKKGTITLHGIETDIGTFLSRGPLNPEHQALLRLIATLVDDGAETPADRSAGC